MNFLKFGFNTQEIFKRALKYIIIALVVAFATYNIPETQLSQQEVIMISITAACTFAIIDMYAPTVYSDNKIIINSDGKCSLE
jgi:ABC-type Co2+ transport system permease subunit